MENQMPELKPERSRRLARLRRAMVVALCLVLALVAYAPAQAQEVQPTSGNGLTLFTSYPGQMAEIGESVNFALTLRVGGSVGQVVELGMGQIPEGWTATFTGEGRVVQSVYVEPGTDATVNLKLEPPAEVAAETYRFVVTGQAGNLRSELPLELTVKEKLPSRLAFDVELPVLKGSPSTTFNYDVDLKNEGEEELTVNLQSTAPEGFQVKFQLSGKEVTSFPIGANENKNISVAVTPPPQVPAGQYQFVVSAQAGDVQEQLQLVAEVTGQATLAVSTPDQRLSGEAEAGKSTPFKITVSNNGSAPAREVKLSSTEPSGWSVRFEPEQIPEIAPGQQQQVTAHIQPAEKAISGDYMVNVSATGEGLSAQSVDLRVTVVTSTLWGIVGVVLIAIAVGVVGMAVSRFGRR